MCLLPYAGLFGTLLAFKKSNMNFISSFALLSETSDFYRRTDLMFQIVSRPEYRPCWVALLWLVCLFVWSVCCIADPTIQQWLTGWLRRYLRVWSIICVIGWLVSGCSCCWGWLVGCVVGWLTGVRLAGCAIVGWLVVWLFVFGWLFE